MNTKKSTHILTMIDTLSLSLSDVRTGSIRGNLGLLGVQCGRGPVDSRYAGLCSSNIWDVLLPGRGELYRILLCAADSARNKGRVSLTLVQINVQIYLQEKLVEQ